MYQQMQYTHLQICTNNFALIYYVMLKANYINLKKFQV
jgi:hypothetical protein